MMRPLDVGRRSDRGAALLVVAFTLLTLAAFSALAVDHGLLWVARAQAQNAADAAAHAGAVALAFNSFNNRTSSGPAVQAALATASGSRIWAEPPAVTSADVTFPAVAGDSDCASGATPPCVRVNVYRNQDRGNPLPTFFGRLVGVTSQGVRATATAKAEAANASTCLKPWMLADRWQELRSPASAFNRYNASGNLINPPRDYYEAPGAASTGTGYRLADIGTGGTLSLGTPGSSLRPLFFYPVTLPLADGGFSGSGAGYRAAITGCNGVTLGLGDMLESVTGGMGAATRTAVNALIAQDPGATWNSTNLRVEHSCAQAIPPCAPMSPRIVAVPLFSPDTYAHDRLTGRFSTAIVNIIGLFVVSVNSSGNVTGYLSPVRGVRRPGTTVAQQSSFSRDIVLVR